MNTVMRNRMLLSLFLVSCGALAQTPAIDSSDTVDVIVRSKPTPDNIGHRCFIAHGASHKTSLSLIGAHVFTVGRDELALLSSDPALDHIGLDHRLAATSTKLPPGCSTRIAEAERRLRLPSLNILGPAGALPIRDERLQGQYSAGAVNLTIPVFNGHAFSARYAEAEQRAQAAGRMYKT